ncbi:TetR/AcrR family transcriptional regulator [Bradyrhizobium sp. 2TAF24]|uniref:TetR/AcrR family transcriptional regulator n=1 Tax=Bradyrhizobium sp. 2TAF24 TaxID=3233011 RepID=UPI003F919AA2
MPRVVKHPEVRRNELLDCAQGLFLARGYEQASLNDVIAAAGVSKGAFYHYFSSKEALLEALAERFARAALERVRDVLDAPGLDALARLNALMARLRQNKVEHAVTEWALFETLFRPENQVLFHRINVAAGALFHPLLTTIITEGVAGGVFHTFDPAGVADMIMQLGGATRGLVADIVSEIKDGRASTRTAIRRLEQRIHLYEIALDRVLGLPDGSIKLTAPGYLRLLMTARHHALAGSKVAPRPARKQPGTRRVAARR